MKRNPLDDADYADDDDGDEQQRSDLKALVADLAISLRSLVNIHDLNVQGSPVSQWLIDIQVKIAKDSLDQIKAPR